jgi:thymidylate synthase (FAD)
MRIAVLDHGYVEFIEAWGYGRDGAAEPLLKATEDSTSLVLEPDYERGIIEAARQSTQGSFRGWEQDAKLLAHLYNNRHATPFEFAGMVIEVQAPIFVFREWHRHRTQSYNEMSARYSPLPDLYYQPTAERLHATSLSNKQAQAVGGRALTGPNGALFLDRLQNFYRIAETHYQNALADGVPKELARLVMPVAHYSRMRASANLRNWLAFLTLRMDQAAQWEIQQFAKAVGDVIAAKFPQTWTLFRQQDAAREPQGG